MQGAEDSHVPTLFDDEGMQVVRILGRQNGKTHAMTVHKAFLIEDGQYGAPDGNLIRVTSDRRRKVWQVRTDTRWTKVFQITLRPDGLDFWQMGKSDVANAAYNSIDWLYTHQMQGRQKYATACEHCTRCSKPIRDPRSIHYTIGPDCEELQPEIVAAIDELHGGLSWEELQHEDY